MADPIVVEAEVLVIGSGIHSVAADMVEVP